MTAVAMRSPTANMSSPVYTPAVLQNELPPWAHPTPSPSQMIRRPDFRGDTDFKYPEVECNTGVPKVAHPLQHQLVPESLTIPPELLWGICMPFIQQMLQALQHAMQSEIKAQLALSCREDGPPDATARDVPKRSATDLVSGSPPMPDRANVSPFHSLFNPTPTGHDVHPSHRRKPIRRGTPPGGEPLHEEADSSDHDQLSSVAKNPWHGQGVKKSSGVEDDALKSLSSVTGALANADVATMGGEEALQGGTGSGLPQRVTLLQSGPSLGNSSTGASPLSEGLEPASGFRAAAKNKAASVGSSPVLPWRAIVSAECSNATTSAEANPIYVRYSQQHVSQGWRDQKSLDEASDCGNGLPMQRFEPTETCDVIDMDAELDKSIMVCRHWKSKGWCRLEDRCKFLHPENKRGGGTARNKGSGAGSNADRPSGGILGGANAQEEGKVAAKSKPSRRAGRNRRGTRATISDSHGSMGSGGIDVLASTTDSYPVHQASPEAAMSGQPTVARAEINAPF
mmetsp:Transcript_104577/g.207649  ORF Transcript_104577/g.207649 Transcript_104577/m.207649 type:complete len:512 (-) Transcript_104577:78-1613(-)